MRPYPIAAQTILSAVPRRGLRRRVRSVHEMLFATACEVLVYRVNGEFVLDHGSWGPDHTTVLKATHVSLVDTSVNKPVTVDLEVPTRDAGVFTVRTTFLCTVTEPVAVVAAGRSNVVAYLEHYLRGRYQILELGHSRDLEEVTRLRPGTGVEIAEIIARDLPVEPGMRISVSDVTIRLPQEVTVFESLRRELRRSGRVAHESATIEHTRAVRASENEHTQRLRRQQVDFDFAEEELRQKRKLAEEWGSFEVAAVRQLAAAIEGSPERALYLALVRNGLGPVEFTDRLREHVTYNARSRSEEDRQVRMESSQMFGQRLNVLTKLIQRGEFDSLGIDSEKKDLLFTRFVDEVSALASVPVTELPPAGPVERSNGASGGIGDDR